MTCIGTSRHHDHQLYLDWFQTPKAHWHASLHGDRYNPFAANVNKAAPGNRGDNVCQPNDD